MSDERQQKSSEQAENLADWRHLLCSFENKTLAIIQNNLGNCSNKPECAKFILDKTLDSVASKSIREIEHAEKYFNTSAVHIAWRYPQKCLACSKKCTSLDAEDNRLNEYADEQENRRIRWNGQPVNYNINGLPSIQKNTEDRELILEKLKSLRKIVDQLSDEEKSLLSDLIVSDFENKEIFLRLRKIDPHISPENVRTKKCRLLKKIKGLMKF